jgi:hypothetical protein
MRWSALAVGLSCAAEAQAQLRVVTYNIVGLAGNQTALRAVFSSFHTDNKQGFATPVGLFLFSEVGTGDTAALLALVNQAAPAGYTYALATFTGSGTEDSASGAQAAIYRTDLITEIPSGHIDLSTGASRNSDRWLFQLNGYTSANARFYVYQSHLKASSGSANVATRLSGVQTLRANCDALGVGVRAFYSGDMNFYTRTESGYQAFIAAGNGAAVDPLGTADWTGASNAWKHTQSPRDILADGLVGGGMDDRFDFILPTAPLSDGAGLAVIPGTTRALGNDGNHFDTDINQGNNTYYPGNLPRSNALADALWAASDHIPVIVDFKVPAWCVATLGAYPARVIQGATVVTVPVLVTNDAPGDFAVGIDALQFTAAGSGVLSGSQSGTAPLSPSVATVNLPVSTSAVGVRSGTATVTSANQGVQNPSTSLPVSVHVLRRSNPSLSTTSDADSASLELAAEKGGAPVTGQVPVANHGFGADQSRLSIVSVAVPPGPFSPVGSTEGEIGAVSGSVTFRFDPAGLAPGDYSRTATVTTRDESIPGAASTTVTVFLAATVTGAPPVPADLNADGAVDGNDLGIMLAAWGLRGPADLNGDGTVDGNDLGQLLAAWG